MTKHFLLKQQDSHLPNRIREPSVVFVRRVLPRGRNADTTPQLHKEAVADSLTTWVVIFEGCCKEDEAIAPEEGAEVQQSFRVAKVNLHLFPQRMFGMEQFVMPEEVMRQ